MASKLTYECYVCKKNNFPDVRVYLDGKDENGRTNYLNEDMSPHRHNILITNHQEQSRRNIPTTQAQTEQKDAPQFRKTLNSTTSSMQESQQEALLTRVTEEQQLVANVALFHKELMDKMQNIENKLDHMSKLIYAINGNALEMQR